MVQALVLPARGEREGRRMVIEPRLRRVAGSSPPSTRHPIRTRLFLWIPGLVLLAAVVWLAARNVEEERAIGHLLARSRPGWLIAAVAAQVGTYATAAAAWRIPLRARGESMSLRSMMELALLKLTADQAVPTGGMSGVVMAARRLRSLGVDRSVVASTLATAAVGYYLAYAVAVLIAVTILWLDRDLGQTLAGLATLFAVTVALVPLALVWLLGRQRWRPPRWLRRVPWVEGMLGEMGGPTPLLISSWPVVARSAMASFGTFVLDSATLTATLLAVGSHAPAPICFAAMVMGQVAATIGIVPAGLGTFEAVSVATLAQAGTPVADALSGVLLLRAFTFWLPMLPGLMLARRTRNTAA
jgi:uncharacterized membrane protein YbhN (UPF0104 family)